jgi:uncharacterized protein YutE (UPF0331/DUF86 family)
MKKHSNLFYISWLLLVKRLIVDMIVLRMLIHRYRLMRFVGMRNRLVHEYRDVDYRVVWDAIEVDIPELLDMLLPLVKNSE